MQIEDDDRWRDSVSLKSKCRLLRSEVMFADSGVVADKTCDALSLMLMKKDVKTIADGAYAIWSMPMRRDVKTAVDEACGMLMGQEPMRTSSWKGWTRE